MDSWRAGCTRATSEQCRGAVHLTNMGCWPQLQERLTSYINPLKCSIRAAALSHIAQQPMQAGMAQNTGSAPSPKHHAMLSAAIDTSDPAHATQGPTVVLAIQGAGQASAATMTQYPHAESSMELHKGDVFFVPFDTPLQITASASGPLRLWIAGVNQRVFGEQGPQAAPNGVTYAKEAQLLPSLA